MNLVLWVATVVLLIPVAVVCIEIAAASFLPSKQISIDRLCERPRATILIPAHDEAEVIGMTLASVRRQMGEHDRLVVVADNCADATAEISRRAGAEVLERFDLEHCGKGFALQHGVRSLDGDPPPIVVLLDADVTLREGAIDALVRQAHQTDCPAQGVYILREAPSPDGLDFVSHLAFVVRNQVRPLGLARLNGPCPLFGCGMAFPWLILSGASLASANIVEDMALGLDLALAGHAAMLCIDASIDGVFPKAPDSANTQRRRWAHGHLMMIFTKVPAAFFASLVTRRPLAAVLAADLFVPPLSYHLLMLGMMSVVAGAASLLTGASMAPAFTLMGGAAALMVFLLIAWFRFSPSSFKIQLLLSVPVYIVKKLPLYFHFFTRNRETAWRRTGREVSISGAVGAVDADFSPEPVSDGEIAAEYNHPHHSEK